MSCEHIDVSFYRFHFSRDHDAFRIQILVHFVFTNSSPFQETKEETLKKLFVGGLSRDTTDDQFRDYFAQFGNVTDHIVIKDGDGISK